jgi:hypothetical protein
MKPSRVLLCLLDLPAAMAPSVYWVSNPNLAGETVTIAGAGFTQTTEVRLCADSACSTPHLAAIPGWIRSWESSVKFIMPTTGLTPPMWARLCKPPCGRPTVTAPAYTVAINQPDVLWHAGVVYGAPGGHNAMSPMASTVAIGGTLRVFGRSLAWDDSGTTCRSANARGPALGTILRIAGRQIAATAATCFEASFDTRGVPAGTFASATLSTIWGRTELNVTVVPPAPAADVIVLDVDSRFNGDVASALLRASSLPLLRWKEVRLGARQYNLNQSVRIPGRTLVVGLGAGRSILAFNLGAFATVWDAAMTASGPVPPAQCVGDTSSTPRPGQRKPGDCASQWSLANFSLLILSAPAHAPAQWGSDELGTKAVHARGRGWSITGLQIDLRQKNGSNAIFVEGHDFMISNNTLTQHNLCFWGDQHHEGMHDDSTDFVDSPVLRMHAATNGLLNHNTINWKCGGYDMDVSSRIIFEDNTVRSTEAGVEPHGNSISFYDWRNCPASQLWVFNHNRQSRPPHNDPENWAYHESLTTDGSGGWGSGNILRVDGRTLVLDFKLDATDRWGSASPVGATAVLVSGPGLGQSREIVASTFFGASNTTQIVASLGWDGFVTPGKSVVAVVASAGSRIISGNTFAFGMVVQWFGTTLAGVISDNTFISMHSASGGSLAGRGLCYVGPQPLFFCEFSGNMMLNSGGIDLIDEMDCSDPITCCNTSFGGPFLRWVTVRRNNISGVRNMTGRSSAVNEDCGQITLRDSPGFASTDVVVEGNTLRCANASLFPDSAARSTGGIDVTCLHCAVRIWPSCSTALANLCGTAQWDPVLCGVCIERNVRLLSDGGGCDNMTEAEAWCRSLPTDATLVPLKSDELLPFRWHSTPACSGGVCCCRGTFHLAGLCCCKFSTAA